MQPIIQSLLDTDLYKFTMWQTMLHRHPQTDAEYSFVCRNQPAYPLSELLGEVNAQLDHLCTLRFQPEELAYLRGLRFMKSDFVDFLRIFEFQREFITVTVDGPTLAIKAVGPQVHTMAFEIFVLAIVNELYFRRFDQGAALVEGRRRLQDKIAILRAFEKEPSLRNESFCKTQSFWGIPDDQNSGALIGRHFLESEHCLEHAAQVFDVRVGDPK